MDVRRGFFALLLVLLGVVTALLIAPLLQYVLAAGLLAFVFYPLQRRLAPEIGERPSAIVLTGIAIVVAVIPLLIFSVIVLQTVLTFLNDLDLEATTESAREAAYELGIEEELLSSAESQLVAEAEARLSAAVEIALFELVGLVNTTIEVGIGLMILLFLLYYLLVDGPEFVAWLGDIAPLHNEVRERLTSEVESVTWAVIYSHVLVALIEGVLGGLGLWLVGIPNVAFWTVVMIVVAFLPVIGVWLVWAPAVTYLALSGDTLGAVVLLLYGVAVLSVVDNYLRAIFVDHGSGLHPAVVIVGVIGGIYLLGFLGLFLGPILLAVFKAALNVFGDFYGPDGSSEPASVSDEPADAAPRSVSFVGPPVSTESDSLPANSETAVSDRSPTESPSTDDD